MNTAPDRDDDVDEALIETFRGKVLGGGGDWVTTKPDGTLEVNLPATLETDDGALIHMTFTGVRDVFRSSRLRRYD